MHYERVSMSKTVNLLMCLCLISEIFCIFAFESTYSMKKIVYIALLCSLLFALGGCNGQSSSPHRGSRWEATLSLADSLMRTRPDSALKLLQAIPSTETTRLGKKHRMRYQLLLADAQNKCYVNFTTDSVMKEVVKYYNHSGTPNDRMLAHYLLGCTYRDMGEAPKELECFQKAVVQADTTDSSCDYVVLSAIYGQMADLYHQQYLPRLELDAIQKYEKFCWVAKDTLAALNGYELRFRPYWQMNRADSVEAILTRAREKYLSHGDTALAARASATLIRLLLEKGKCDDAKQLMDIYEKKSGLFDDKGNIEKRRELYYYYKGMYLQGVGKMSEATHYYRKALSCGKEEAAYKGLLSVYVTSGNADSIAKYARLYCDANDSANMRKNVETISRMSALYDYNRHQHIAELAQAESRHIKDVLIIASMAALIVITLLVYVAVRFRRQSQKKIAVLRNNYRQTKDKLLHAQRDMELLNYKYEEAIEKHDDDGQEMAMLQSSIKEKDEEIRKLQEHYSEAVGKLKNVLGSKQEKKFKQSQIYKRIQYLSTFRHDQPLPTVEEWQQFDNLFKECFPMYHSFISQPNKLNTNNQRYVCELIRLGFSPSEDAVLLGVPKGRISKIKVQINRIFWNENTAETLDGNLLSYF